MNEKNRAGRKPKVDPAKVAIWRRENKASIANTAQHFGIGARTVAKACADQAEVRVRQRGEHMLREVENMDDAEKIMDANMAHLKETVARADRAREQGLPLDTETFLDVLDAAHRLIPPNHRDRRGR